MPDGIQPQEKSLHAVTSAEQPKNRRQLRQFMGTVNWLREFIPCLGEISAPLTNLLSTQTKWTWTREVEDAFARVKKAAGRIKMLLRPEMGHPLILQTDASKEGLGPVLFQEIKGARRIISFASAKLRPAKQRYHSNELECLAIVWAIKRYRLYLEDQHFVLRTDNAAMQWLHNFRDSRTKITRWALLLQEFSSTTEHCPGKQNELPDALGRPRLPGMMMIPAEWNPQPTPPAKRRYPVYSKSRPA